MYKYTVEQCRDEIFLTKLINRFRRKEIPRFQRLQEYYDVETAILRRTIGGGKPNNRIAHGFARYISNMATSYFLGKPVTYKTDQEDYENALLWELKNNYINKVNYDVSKECSKKGIGFYLLFIDETGTLRIKKCDAETMIPVYSPRLGEFLECAIRLWDEYDIDGKLLAKYAALYDRHDIITYQCDAGDMIYRLQDAEGHQMSDIPVIVVWNNEEITGDYEPHISLMDAYDKAQSDTANDMEYFSDAYLCIAGASELLEGAGATGEENEDLDRASMSLRKNRILFLDEKGQAEWLVKNINDTAVENYKDRIYNNLFFLCQVPALSDESFAGNLTGVAIRYKLIGLEELAIMKQNSFEAAQKKLVQLVTDFINRKQNKNYDADTVSRKYERNFVSNTAELVEVARNLEGIVSRETQLEILPTDIVPNANTELQRMRTELMEKENIPYINPGDI